MKVLVTNDDGYKSVALKELIKQLKKIVEVVVYTPAKCESAQSQKITIHKPIKVRKTKILSVETNVVYGSTADCVRLGCFDHPDIDLVISGVNTGLNLGQDIYYSSTISGVLQAGLLGYRGVALSCDKNYDVLGKQLKKLLKEVILNNNKYEPIINVNLPVAKYDDYLGLKFTIQGNRYFENKFTYEDGCYLESNIMVEDYTDGTDSGEVNKGYVSISNIQLQRTYLK